VTDAHGENWAAPAKSSELIPHGLRRVAAGAFVQWRRRSSIREVSVDTETGFVKVNKITCIQDGGLIVSKLTAESQVNGGIIMGIGYALYEERVMDRTSGVVLNPNFETYKLTQLADVPEIDVVFLDMPERGVIGIGERSQSHAAAVGKCGR
jgi:xanthine dehydrogenase YagR molybdenum-binding subunit